jgi:prepilin-type N-terminal cleavage/methylation domain-containing protein
MTDSIVTFRENSRADGFTLVELSIVLVIIGLIVGGLLVGQTLVKAASMRNQMKQMEDLETQINTFRGKYNCYPGDCINATTFLGTAFNGNTISNGDGSGIVQSQLGSGAPYSAYNCLDGAPAGEVTQLFLHLDAAGMAGYTADGNANGAGVSYPAITLGGGGMYVTCLNGVGDNSAWTPISMFLSGNVIVVGAQPSNGGGNRIFYSIGAGYNTPMGAGIGIPVEQAAMIDQKIDDGFPNMGRFGVVAGPGCLTPGGITHSQITVSSSYSAASNCFVTVGKNIGTGE